MSRCQTIVLALCVISLSFCTGNCGDPEEQPDAAASDTGVTADTDVGDGSSEIIEAVLPAAECPPDSSLLGWIHVLVVDETNAPLANVTVSLVDSEKTTLTDDSGTAILEVDVFRDIPGGRAAIAMVRFELEGYTTALRRVPVVPGRDASTRPVVLVPLEPAQMFGPDGGTYRSLDGEIELVIPAGSLSEDVPIQLTNYVSGRELPGPLPYPSVFTYALQALPDGTAFDPPATLRIANVIGLPAGLRIPVGQFNTETGVWEHETVAYVSDDGDWVEYEVEHFTDYDVNLSSRTNDGNMRDYEPADDEGAYDIPEYDEDGDGGDQGDGSCGGSVVNERLGTFMMEHELPSIYVNGAPQRLRLIYDTTTVRPGVLFAIKTFLDSVEDLLHDSYRVVFSIEGRRIQARFTDDLLDHEQRYFFDGLNARGEQLTSGSYPYAIEVISDRTYEVYAETENFGEPGDSALLVQLREPQEMIRRFVGRFALRNLIDSAFGSGWTVDGLVRLYLDPDGGVLLTQGSRGNHSLTPTLGGFPRALLRDTTRWVAAVEEDNDGNLFIGQPISGIILRVSPSGDEETLATILGGIAAMHFDSQREVLYVTSPGRNTVLTVDQDGTIDESIALVDRFRIGNLAGLDVDDDGTVFVVDRTRYKVWRIDPEGTLVEHQDLSLFESLNPEDIALDSEGGYYLADRIGQRVVHIDSDGNSETVYHSRLDVDEVVELVKEFVSGGVDDVVNELIAGVQALEVGPDGTVYVLDARKGMVLALDGAGADIVATDPRYDPDDGVLTDITFGPDGSLLISSYRGTVFRVYPDRTFYRSARDPNLVLEQLSDGSFRLEQSDGSVALIDDQGFVQTRYATDGAEWTYTYDSDCQLATITDPAEGQYVFAYENHRIASITDPAGRVTQFDVDVNGDLVGIIDADGSETEFDYDDTHLMTAHRNAAGHETQYEYGRFDRLNTIEFDTGEVRTWEPGVLIGLLNDVVPDQVFDLPAISAEPFASITTRYTSGEGGITQTIYTPSGRRALRFDPLNRMTTWIYGDGGRVFSITRPGQSVETFAYDTRGRLVTHNRGLVAVAQFTYAPIPELARPLYDPSRGGFRPGFDPFFGGVASFTDAELNVWQFHRDETGRVTTIERPDGYETVFEYDDDGLVTSVTQPGGGRRVFVRDDAGNVVSETDPLGHSWLYQRDDAGRVTQVTSPEGNRIRLGWDEMSRITSLVDGLGNVTSFDWTPSGTCPSCGVTGRQPQLASVTDPLGNQISYEHDANGNLVATNLPDGRSIEQTYDLDRRLIRIEERVGDELRLLREIERDLAGQITSVSQPGTDGGVVATTYEYDPAGRLTAVVQPSNARTEMEWGWDSDLESVTLPGGMETVFEFDDIGRLVSLTDPDGRELTWSTDSNGWIVNQTTPDGETTFDYDPDGLMTLAVGPDGTVELDYDLNGQLIRELQNGLLWQHRYDDDGRLVLTEGPWGDTERTFNAGGRLTNVVLPNGDDIELTWDAASRLIEVAYPGGVTRSTSVDQLGRPLTIDVADDAGESIFALVISYDEHGNVVSIEDDEGRHVYSWDARDRLTAVNHPGEDDENYGYDDDCNRILSHLADEYEIEALGRTIRVGDTTYLYDDAGNRVQRTDSTGTTTFQFDIFGRIREIQRSNGTLLSYRYDPLGRLLSRELTPVGETAELTLNHYWQYELLAQTSEAGESHVEITPGAFPFRPLALTMGDNVYAIHPDPSGSVRLLTGADGSVVNRLSYEAFGQIRSESGTISSPLGFAGQPRDIEAGLSFFWGRAYDPFLGQFTSVDPVNIASVSWLLRDPTIERDLRDDLLINPPAQHPYAYAHHNPLRYEDPLGLAANCSGDRSWWDDMWWTINRLWGHTSTMTGIGLVDWVTDIITSDDPNRAAGEAARDLIPSEDVRDAYDDFMDFPNSTRR